MKNPPFALNISQIVGKRKILIEENGVGKDVS
jgi:hypothetical protein